MSRDPALDGLVELLAAILARRVLAGEYDPEPSPPTEPADAQ